MFYTAQYHSPVGTLTLSCDGTQLTGLWIQNQKYFGATLSGKVLEQEELPVLVQTKEWLDRYFSGTRPEISELPLSPAGSPFRQTVWQLLCEIPWGSVTTYGEIARKAAVQLGRQTLSSQAVGGAVGHNPISIIIPCHRVVGSDGGLTGYAGGLDKKIWLLKHEGVVLNLLKSGVVKAT